MFETIALCLAILAVGLLVIFVAMVVIQAWTPLTKNAESIEVKTEAFDRAPKSREQELPAPVQALVRALAAARSGIAGRHEKTVP